MEYNNRVVWSIVHLDCHVLRKTYTIAVVSKIIVSFSVDFCDI